ncbi:MAG TPA: lipopolysaccharide biosynthesis protein [Flavisolibacter sp.]|nr:lipopolysaccharide biosynthesis protein [Flavisolibacter sp.]
METEVLKSKMLSGLKWNSISLIATRSTDFIVKLILARLLLPESFGVVGMAMIIINFLTVCSDMGFFHALIQKKDEELREVRYSTVFWYLFLIAVLFVFLFVFFISPLGARFYDEPRLEPVLNALSFHLFFCILYTIPRVILTKQLDFKSLTRITYSGTILSSVIAITMAFLNFGVWSLVAKSLVGSSVICFSYWLKVGWRPKFIFHFKSFKELARYSFFTQVTALLFYFRNILDYLIIGKLVSAHMLGIYTLAYTLTETLKSQLYTIFGKVFFPIYSKIQDDKSKIKHYYLKIMHATAVLTFPISFFFIGLSENIIMLFFGERWIEAAVPLRILSFASIIFSISGTSGEVLKSIGKPSAGFYMHIANTFIIALPLIYFGQVYFGLAGVAGAVCIHSFVSRMVFHTFMKKYIGLTNKDVYDTLKKPFMAALFMLCAIFLVNSFGLSLLPNFILASLSGVIVYCTILFDDLSDIVTHIRKRRTAAAPVSA